MRTVRFIFLFTATTIVLLHSMIAHSHHSEFTVSQHKQQHIEAKNLIDFIQLGFHLDQGDGHLKDMTFSDSPQLDEADLLPLVGLIAVHFYLVEFPSTREFVVERSGAFSEILLTKSNTLRGPPSQS